jgi:hypothetical protein
LIAISVEKYLRTHGKKILIFVLTLKARVKMRFFSQRITPIIHNDHGYISCRHNLNNGNYNDFTYWEGAGWFGHDDGVFWFNVASQLWDIIKSSWG